MQPPYDVHNFLRLLGIELVEEGDETSARLTVRHDLIAGTGYLRAPVVLTVANETTGKPMAAYRCTQLIIYAR